MGTEQFFDLLLDFGKDWQVIEVESNLETDEVDIYIDYVGQAKVYDYAPKRRWRHLDTMQFKSFINCRLPRIRTEEGKVKTLSPPWADKHERHSYLFESAVINLLQATQNQTRTAGLMRCSFDTVNRIMHGATRRGMERRQEVEEMFENLSVDEKSFQKGHSYVSVLSHPETERVLEVVEHRTLEACRGLINTGLTDTQRKQVKTISMDMWEAFMTMAREKLPDAEIVHDKFHLIKYLNEAIDKVRRREVKEQVELKNSRYALLKNEENLTEKQRIKFEAIRAANYEVSRAWQARENFKEVFKNASFEESEAIFWEWFRAVKESGIKEVIKVGETFENHLRGVLNAMTSNLSNAMAERLNGKIQLLKSIGRGYRKFENFRSAILFFYGKLSLFPLNSQ
jgi:transposase